MCLGSCPRFASIRPIVRTNHAWPASEFAGRSWESAFSTFRLCGGIEKERTRWEILRILKRISGRLAQPDGGIPRHDGCDRCRRVPAGAGRTISMTTATGTTYLGLALRHPFVAGASPLAATIDGARRLEDGGAAAIVLPSLFEEQITLADSGRIHGIDPMDDPTLAPLVRMFPAAREYHFGPDEYLEHLHLVKQAVRIPVMASLNGSSRGAWLTHAKALEQAGADALELNFYAVVTDDEVGAQAVEHDLVLAVRDLKAVLHIPIAIKLSPFFTAFANMARRLDAAGANGLVVFNRFYQPDIDLATLAATPTLELSQSAELRLRLRWLAILHGRVGASLAATGGVETWMDGVKAILAGASAVQMVSALLRHGPGFMATMVAGLTAWMESNGISGLDEVRGRVSLAKSPHPGNFERANYINALHHWRADTHS